MRKCRKYGQIYHRRKLLIKYTSLSLESKPWARAIQSIFINLNTTARMQPRCANYRSQKVQSVDSKASRPTTTNEKTMCETYRQFHGSLSYYYLVYIIVNRGSSIYTISKHNRNKKLFLFI